MLKSAGLVLLAGAFAFAGLRASLRLTGRVRRLERFLRFLQNAQTDILFSSIPVVRLLERHGGELPFLLDCAARCRGGEDFSDAWASAVRGAEGFSPEDRELLLRFGEGLGASGAQGQQALCRLTMTLTEQRLAEAREEQQKKGRLCRTLGVLGGVGAALLFC